METWEKEIRKFDKELKRRMKVIWKFERTGFNIDKPILLRRLMGYPDRFTGPIWRNWVREWQFRNREYLNEVMKLRYRKARDEGCLKKREYQSLKVYQDR
jgi:hypothetical protein